MIEVLVLGGPLMVPILLASVVALAVFMARGWSLRASRVRPAALVQALEEDLEAGRPDAALARCRGSEAPLARVLAAGLAHPAASRAERKERMEEVGRREVARLERWVGVVGVIASIEPLLGLLGTVTGMIGVFQGVVADGVGDPATLASGIWSALVTTAAGLSTGIPAFVAWRSLVGLVDRRADELETHAVALLDRTAPDRPHTPTASEAA
ncbi:MAG TPA: MotA/TolQ/ExbB proton channel family protein [Sandaracinaceae bacterium LLY-WYZ-13_1]|nr:MotA/TolQ/ExbB proton channel family protein [Sandaracinaceae bacterium LLY-WYZ-13_1]